MANYEIYGKLSDEELVARYHDGDDKAADYLVEKYKNLVRQKARSYFLAGGDNDDLIQEGMIGLYKSIRDYEPDKDAIFMTFASLCVSRQIRTAVTTYNRKKNSPLNSYISLDMPVTDETGEDAVLSDVIASGEGSNPEELYFMRERINTINNAVQNVLSKMERQVLEMYIEGMSYAQIAANLGKTPKAVDNAIQRIRNKISKNS